MSDFMDRPPTDHGSDRYGYVELVNAPEGVEPPDKAVDYLLSIACQDCNPNLFFHWFAPDVAVPPASDPRLDIIDINGHHWQITVAHDEGCPTYRAIQKER